MNKENMQSLIDLMKTVPDGDFHIARWQTDCGTPSCVAGWATTLPSWQEEGELATYGPAYMGENGQEAFSMWADIPEFSAAKICGTLSILDLQDFYGIKEGEKVTPQHVVAALTQYLEEADA